MDHSRDQMPVARAKEFTVDCERFLKSVDTPDVDKIFTEASIRIGGIRLRDIGGIVKSVEVDLRLHTITVTLDHLLSSSKFTRLMRDCEKIITTVAEEFATNDDEI